MGQSTLHSDRLTLIPLGPEHLEFEVELDSDPEVMRFLTGRARSRAEVEQVHGERLEVADRVDGLGFWIGTLRDTNEPVGFWILEPPEHDDQAPLDGRAELGYRLLRRFWRQGFASEGSRELLRHAFTDLGLHQVFAETMAVNAGSRATMASIGMRFVRTFHKDYDDALPGTDQGEVEYAITAEDWNAQALSP